MNFDVKRNSEYMELIAFEGSAKIETGLMDEDETITMIKSLLLAAEMLMPPNMEAEGIIQNVREAL